MAYPYVEPIDFIDNAGMNADAAFLNALKRGVTDAQKPPLVSVLPSAPVNKQMCRLVVDKVKGIAWTLQYIDTWPDGTTNTSAFKWHVVGRAVPFYGLDNVGGSIGGAAFAAVGGVPSIVIPNAGDYIITYGTQVTGGNVQLAPSGAGITPDANETVVGVNVNATPMRQGRFDGLTAGGTITLQGSGAGGSTFTRTKLLVEPVRIG